MMSVNHVMNNICIEKILQEIKQFFEQAKSIIILPGKRNCKISQILIGRLTNLAKLHSILSCFSMSILYEPVN